jgi:hypothetical protein
MPNRVTAKLTAPLHLEEDQQRLILTSLIRATRTMRNIDELFQWISGLMVQRFRAQVAQVWTTQAGFAFPQLRSLVKQDQSLPQSLIINTDIAAFAERLLRAGQPSSFDLVDTAFSPNLARLLHQNRLNYYANSFLSSPTFLLPPATQGARELLPSPLEITLLLFFQKIPIQHEISSINAIFQNILPIAKSRGLLLPASPNVPSLFTKQRF